MKTSDFFYELPQELIAQTPLDRRDASRLLVLDKRTGERQHTHFHHILDHLTPGDLLVLNDSRVIPARIFGKRDSGEARVEFLLLREKEPMVWECMTRPGKKARPGTRFDFGEGLSGTVEAVVEEGLRLVRFESAAPFYEVLDRIGSMPLPPYIKETLTDNERYQTVYSTHLGSAAAPTAGLHFTPELLAEAEQRGIGVARVTLHVGLGTFRPVKVEDVTEHHMHSEWCHVPEETARAVNETKACGGRIVSVGTTSCRTLESMAKDGRLQSGSRDTDIFIYPPYEFQIVDALITNFHLPESTLLMLVSALAGKENIMAAYREAVELQYRFFSFGDACLIQ
ncbi:MAG: tRNA preQ1(34) S-adenosylmethionine ribosyltransferase-isomerase QueA [Clostridia bacterium]|nr:tRNA preQ1(34) S-adenosylmethionine ribosyltransferase-isomerase QueA [Clostridia bacterium]